MRTKGQIIAAAALAFCLLTGPALAQGIKERMLERLPAVTSLLAEGVVGENNRGFLEFRGPEKHAEVVGAENADRTQVYAAIARQTGSSADLVGQRRADHIARQAPAGTWLQDPSGTWYRK
ncbi:DUF1318 domain-containing protein [Pseudodesulfovibrio sp. F-1]|uniref:DUF1318 domain-containing protein n=1 Tax=Pseudodesulfovibrio alkaliphilus TaxID=2661613 RepID=A0A7K1KNU9_9BACT|nr:DUF1318 domain-containing protein [Pseudodesulfovibrio alkaliphilus]MUM77758.1 DUF1318 domain-containing protein [Pseudodesulfovibrio alkaliphilus]